MKSMKRCGKMPVTTTTGHHSLPFGVAIMEERVCVRALPCGELRWSNVFLNRSPPVFLRQFFTEPGAHGLARLDGHRASGILSLSPPHTWLFTSVLELWTEGLLFGRKAQQTLYWLSHLPSSTRLFSLPFKLSMQNTSKPLAMGNRTTTIRCCK